MAQTTYLWAPHLDVTAFEPPPYYLFYLIGCNHLRPGVSQGNSSTIQTAMGPMYSNVYWCVRITCKEHWLCFLNFSSRQHTAQHDSSLNNKNRNMTKQSMKSSAALAGRASARDPRMSTSRGVEPAAPRRALQQSRSAHLTPSCKSRHSSLGSSIKACAQLSLAFETVEETASCIICPACIGTQHLKEISRALRHAR